MAKNVWTDNSKRCRSLDERRGSFQQFGSADPGSPLRLAGSASAVVYSPNLDVEA